ncbi:MAG: Helix-turn-helix domain protein [Armatimonadetes bacterium OLB18]|nr:MAG: Helix-turn-helix domain protein [Armatimonadetes bacterium OLB18]
MGKAHAPVIRFDAFPSLAPAVPGLELAVFPRPCGVYFGDDRRLGLPAPPTAATTGPPSSPPPRSHNQFVEKFMTTENAAKYLGVTPQRVRQLVAREEIKAEKYGRDYLLDSESVRSYGKSRRKPGRPKK